MLVQPLAASFVLLVLANHQQTYFSRYSLFFVVSLTCASFVAFLLVEILELLHI